MKKLFNSMALLHATGLKKQCLALAICLSAGFISTQLTHASPNLSPPALKASAPHVYVVKKGDTLGDISGKFLSSPWRWKDIWASNRHVKNPHWIYPGDRLLLCTLDGRPLIGRDEGDGCEGVIRRHRGGTSLQPQIRVESLNNTIPIIPLAHIQQWLDHGLIISPESLKFTPYILGTADNRVIAGKGQTVYARGNGLVTGQRYGVFRETEPYMAVDAKGKKYVTAIELLEVASATAVAHENDVTTLELTDSYNAEVRRGDYVLPKYDANLPSLFYPTATADIVADGSVIRVMGSIGTAAQRSVVTIDRGMAHGAKTGHVLSIYQKGEVVRDPKTKESIQLPNQRIGNLMIFKTFDQLSYAYVLDSSLPVKVGAHLQAPSMTDQ